MDLPTVPSLKVICFVYVYSSNILLPHFTKSCFWNTEI